MNQIFRMQKTIGKTFEDILKNVINVMVENSKKTVNL